jgi:hypothetical protein
VLVFSCRIESSGEKKWSFLTLRWHALTKVLPFLVVPTTYACKPISFDSEIRTDGCCVEFCASYLLLNLAADSFFGFLVYRLSLLVRGGFS